MPLLKPRLSLETKEELCNLIKEGKSLNQIKSLIGIKKTTAYYYMLKIKGRRYPVITLNLSNPLLVGKFVGVFAGDGSYSYNKKYTSYSLRIHFNRSEVDVISHYSKIISALAKPPLVYTCKNVTSLKIQCKELANLLKNYLSWEKGMKTHTIHLNNKLIHDKEFYRGFAAGLIDSDGYVRKGSPEVYYGTISPMLMENMKMIMEMFNIRYKIYIQNRGDKSPFLKLRVPAQEALKCCEIFKPVKSGLVVQSG